MYVAVKGGEDAIASAHALLAARRRGDPAVPEIGIDQIREQLALAVDRVMAEGSLYDRDLAALAVKQGRGDLIEAIFLPRAFRTPLPRFGASVPVDTGRMRIRRRISATFKDLPGGQVLGPTFDYTHRLMDERLATIAADGAGPAATPAPSPTSGRGEDHAIRAPGINAEQPDTAGDPATALSSGRGEDPAIRAPGVDAEQPGTAGHPAAAPASRRGEDSAIRAPDIDAGQPETAGHPATALSSGRGEVPAIRAPGINAGQRDTTGHPAADVPPLPLAGEGWGGGKAGDGKTAPDRHPTTTGENLVAPAPIPRVTDLLGDEGLIEPAPADDGTAPADLTRAPLAFPADRALRLQALARGDEGFLLGLGYSTQRGYARTHPFVGEIRFGEVEVSLFVEELGFEVSLGEIGLTECQSVNQFHGSASAPPQFTRGYGLVFGQCERKAMSMALVDRALRFAELGEEQTAPAQDEEFVLSHCDNVQATGFVEHLKLPHYVDFQAELELVRRMRAEHAAAPPAPETRKEAAE